MAKDLEILLLTGAISQTKYAELKKNEKIINRIHKGEING